MAVETDTNNAATGIEEFPLPSQLENLSKLIGEKPEALATGSEDLQKAALYATKFIYDFALATEKEASGKVNELLVSISPSHAPKTRSQTANADGSRKRKRGPRPPPSSEPAVPILKDTPLAELLVDGMSHEQIWAELELRAQTVCDVLNYALDGPVRDGESEEEGSEDDEDMDEGEAAMVQRMKAMRQALLDEGFDLADLEGIDVGEDDEADESEDSEDEDEDEDESEETDEDEGDAEEMDLGEGVEELRDPSDVDEEDELEVNGPSFLSGGKRTLKIKLKRGGHPTLDDGFFDLAAFNAEIEAAESRSSSRGRLSKGDEDEDEDEDDPGEEVDYFASLDTPEAFDEEDLEGGAELFYKDFFEPPVRTKIPKAKKPGKPPVDSPSAGKVRFHEEVRVKKIKAKGKNLPVNTMFYEEEENEDEDGDYEDEESVDDDDEGLLEDEMAALDSDEDDEMDEEDEDVSMEDEDEDASEVGFATMERLKDDLFAEDEEDSQENLSTHEKRMTALREEIASLELENVGKKDWTLMGEATSRSRPQNSLLEEDLEFERVMKSVPVITEDVVHSLEERIKTRILENQFDDVVRRRSVDDKPFLPSRFFELQDSKSKQSLAEIYEDEYTAAKSGGIAGEDRDGKLKKEHQEIEKMWENICGKLDALCNAHFIPKAPKATITSVSNVAAASLESALPTTKATSSMLAPEEVYAPASNDLRARGELTPTEKRAMRNKQKKANRKARDAVQKSVQNFGRPKGVGDVKRQKEAALKTLVKSGKGVTVVGRKNKELAEGKRGRGKI
ncbi:hypothetical protein GSI_06701 [Ganoderma sinense ZZ0214-1]|uniref:Uncharacterized protein n=1 Tax=Ganoderma sinense ZZ0214-1 TaxID=1077348 RepID=A0A2G8SE61_9APHY|nr:hypothetical protein GSI_06701 [Ganoderma sinense ZZ0214-1]